MQRRTFLEKSSLLTAALGLSGSSLLASRPKNALPYWKGFNLVDFNTPDPARRYRTTTDDHLKWMADWGFNFIRLPISYPYYLSFDRSRPIKPEEVYQIDEQAVDTIQDLVHQANKHKLHVSITLHRAPGYCINAGFHEPYNLWKDPEALKAYCFHWNMWAKRFRNASEKDISFDLLNEPAMIEDMNDQLSAKGRVPGDLYRNLIKSALEAIKKENNKRIVIADGNNIGNEVIHEVLDLDVAQSCRGYFPHAISHYKAPWANKNPEQLPLPKYPGQVGDQNFNRQLLENYYKPWIELAAKGVGVHCGEMGAWNKTPHPVMLAWMTDMLDILYSHRIGYALWEFSGDFGIMNSGRSDVDYVDFHGNELDKKLLSLLQKF